MKEKVSIGCWVLRGQDLEGGMEGGEEGDFGVSGVEGAEFEGEEGGEEKRAELGA